MCRKVLITGASRGIGKSIAEAFAKAGDDLFLTCINNIEDLEKNASELSQKYGVNCRALNVMPVNMRLLRNFFQALTTWTLSSITPGSHGWGF